MDKYKEPKVGVFYLLDAEFSFAVLNHSKPKSCL